MMFRGKKIFNASFDAYADNYHSVRPGYPKQMYRDIKELCDIETNFRILEIGAGSGIATRELAKFGCQVVGIEPGENLVQIAKKVTADQRNVEIVEGTFESFESSDMFDIIFAFTAFHWISEGDKYQRVFGLLKDEGSFVLVWNSFFQSDSPVAQEVSEAYQVYLPDVYQDSGQNVNEAVLAKLSSREKELHENGLFSIYFLRRYITVYSYDDKTYPQLLSTFPKVIKIEDLRRKEFLAKIGEIVKKYGKISVPVLTSLIICQKRDFFISLMGTSQENGGSRG